MGFYSARWFPMSSSYIELSSDDEVQIIGEVQNKSNFSTPVQKHSSSSAIQKLSRNSSIQLTISIDGVENEKPKYIPVPQKNGVIPHHQNARNKPSKERKTPISNGYKSDSSDIEIIHVEAPQLKVQPQKQNATPTIIHTKNATSTVVHAKNPTATVTHSKNVTPRIMNSKNATPTVMHAKNATPTVMRSTNVTPRVMNSKNSTPTVINSKNATPTVMHFKNATPTNIYSNQFQGHSIVKEDFKTSSNGLKNNRKQPMEVIMTNNKTLVNSQDKILRQSTSLNMPLATKSTVVQKSPHVKRLDSDVVYITDDDKSDDESTAIVKNSSHTEYLVNAFRAKISQEMQKEASNNTTKKTKVSKQTKTDSSETKKDTRSIQPKKRVNPDQIISSAPLNLQETSFRVTRSSLSLPPSASLDKMAQQSTSKSKSNAMTVVNETMNKYSIENMFSGLVQICKRIFTDDTLEAKLWRTFRQASEQVLRSEDFLNALKMALKTAEESKIESLDDKLMISREIKEVMRIMKRHPEMIDKKIKKLSHMLNLIRSRIRKLEEAEVTSDEEEENNYVLLDRYRTRATKIYEKLCELQGTPSDAGRIVRQRLSFNGNSGYPKIEKAIEKFYHKTKSFPDFFDVKTLVEKTLKKDNVELSPMQSLDIARTLFQQFGNKLKRMRCCDDYSILNDYLDEEAAKKDPAIHDKSLQLALERLDSTKKIKEAEQKIMNEFVFKELEKKSKEGGDKSAESDKSEDSGKSGESEPGSEDEDVTKNTVEKENLHFSDTDEELMNDEVQDGKRKRNSSSSENEKDGETTLLKKNRKSENSKVSEVTEHNSGVVQTKSDDSDDKS